MTKKLAFLGYGLRSKTMLQAFREIEADISVAAHGAVRLHGFPVG